VFGWTACTTLAACRASGRCGWSSTSRVFHHDWERRVFGLNFASLPTTEDGFRYAIERMGAMAYLTTSYYEHWLAAMETIAVEEGVVSGDELAAAGTAAAAGARPPRRDDRLAARRLVAEVTTPPAAGPEPAVGAPEPARSASAPVTAFGSVTLLRPATRDVRVMSGACTG
jgi:hypothetical protein